jgi:hypothetical protein
MLVNQRNAVFFSYNSQSLDDDEPQDEIGTKLSTFRGMDFSTQCVQFIEALNQHAVLQQNCLKICKDPVIPAFPIDMTQAYYEIALAQFVKQIEISANYYQSCLRGYAHQIDLKSSLAHTEALILKTANAMRRYFDILPIIAKDVTRQFAGAQLNVILNMTDGEPEESKKIKCVR